MAPKRIAIIQKLIAIHKPKSVVFHGKTYQNYWEEIIGAPLTHESKIEAETSQNENTLFVSIKNPAGAFGVSNDYLNKIGSYIHQSLKSEST